MGSHFPLPNSHLVMSLHFLCQKFALFVSPFTLPISSFLNGHHCGAEIRNGFSLSVAKKFRSLSSDSQVARLFFPLKKWIKLIPKTIGNRKRDCAWGCARRINTTWKNLQIEKHKSVRWAERTPFWFVLFDLQIFSGGVYPPSATSRTISFSISNSFWY